MRQLLLDQSCQHHPHTSDATHLVQLCLKMHSLAFTVCETSDVNESLCTQYARHPAVISHFSHLCIIKPT